MEKQGFDATPDYGRSTGAAFRTAAFSGSYAPSAPAATTTSAGPSGRFLRGTRKDVTLFAQNYDRRRDNERLEASASTTKANIEADNKRAADAAAEKRALVEGNRRLFARMHPDLPPDQLEALATADPATADRFLGSLERVRAAKAKSDRQAADETATVASAHSQIQQALKRAAAEGLELDAPAYAFDGPRRTPAKEMVRIASVVEKNYDDAFRAKQETVSRTIASDKTLAADRRRLAQHQVDAFERRMAEQKRVFEKVNDRLLAMESFDAGSTKDSPLRAAAEKAAAAYNETKAARDAAYQVIGRLVGFENVIGPDGRPMAEPAAGGSEAKMWEEIDALPETLSEKDYVEKVREIKARYQKR